MADPKIKIVVEADDAAAKRLEATLRNLQKAAEAVGRAMSSAATGSAKYDAATARAALSNERLATQASKTALGMQRVSTEAERTATAHARATAATTSAAAAAQRLTQQQQAQAQSTVGLKDRVDSLVTTLRNVTVAAGIVGTTFSKAFDMAEQGARIDQTAISFQHFSTEIAGMPDLLDRLTAASNGTISQFELMRSTLTLVTGTTEEAGAAIARQAPQLLEIARAAQILNPALGDVDYFFQSLATGIKRLEPRWIDNLGLIVKARDAYAAHARMLGISTTALTAEQKSQAFLNETLRVGQLLIDQNAGAIASAVDPYSRLRVEVEELTNDFKVAMSQGLLPWVQLVNSDFANSIETIIQGNIEAAKSVEDLGRSLQNIAKEMSGPTDELLGTEDELRAGFIATARALAVQSGSWSEFSRLISENADAASRRLLLVDGTIEGFYNEAIALENLRVRQELATQTHQRHMEAMGSQRIAEMTGQMLALQWVLGPTTELTEEQAEALAELREAQADAARSAIENAGSLTEFQKQLLASADAANLTVGELFEFAGALGILSQAEIEAARFAYEFQAANAKMIAGVANGTMTMAAYTARVNAMLAAEQDRLRGQRVAEAVQARANLALAQYAASLGVAAGQALKLKRANDAATQSTQKLANVSAGAASAFINALEGGMTGGGGGSGLSAIDAAAQAQQEWNAAFAQSFIQLLDAKEPIENWNTELLKSAAAAGVSAETLALLAAATGEYSQEQIATALHGAAMKQAIEEISAALVDGRATSDEALAAVAGFQDQLAQGGSLKLDLQAYGIEPLREMAEGAAGGAGSAADETQNWTDNLLKLASQGNLTAGELILLAGATGLYTEEQIKAAVKAMLMTQKLEELARKIDQGVKGSITGLITELQSFESDLDKELELHFSTGDAEEAIGRVHRGIDNLPDRKVITIEIKADPLPDYGSVPDATGGGNYQETQHGGPMMPAGNIVGEVRKELVVGGQVVPRIPPGFFVAQEGFAQTMALALANSMASLPSYNNTTNINRSNTTNNNQKSSVVNVYSGGAAARPIRELGAF